MTLRRIAIALAFALIPAALSAEDIARPFPKDVLAYAELAPADLLKLAESWELDRNHVLDPVLRALSDASGMSVDDLVPELRKVNHAAAALVRIDAKTEKAVFLATLDLAGSDPLRKAVEAKLAALPQAFPAGTGTTMRGNAEGTQFGVIVNDLLIVGNNDEETMAAVGRLKSREAASLADNKRLLRRAEAGFPARFIIDAAGLRRGLAETDGRNDDFAALEALIDLKSVDVVEGRLIVDEKATWLELRGQCTGENRALAMLTGKQYAKLATARYFSIDWGVVAFGSPADAAAQAKLLKDIARDYAAADGNRTAVDEIERIEKLLGLTLDDALTDVSEIGVANRPGAAGEEWLLVAKTKDAARAELLAKRANQVRPEGRWVAAADGEFLLLASGDAVIADAKNVAADDRSIVNERTAKQAQVLFPNRAHGVAYVNPMRLATRMPRNPNAPPPALIGIAWFPRMGQNSFGLGIDLTQMKGLAANLGRFLK